MDTGPEPDMSAVPTQYESWIERLQPESEMEERLVRQIALCSVKLAAIEKLLKKAEGLLLQTLGMSQDEPSP